MNSTLKQLSKMIEDTFGGSLAFACVFGSVARKENTPDSDIDLIIVLKGFAPSVLIDQFKQNFIDFQLKNNISPDYVYPCEIVSVWKLLKATNGYGFITQGGIVKIDPIGKDDWTEFNEYRQWLCAVAGPSMFLVGDEEEYNRLRRLSLARVCLLSIVEKGIKTFRLQDLRNSLLSGGKEYLGFCDTQQTKNYINMHISDSLNLLINDGVLEFLHDEFKVSHLKAFKLLTSLVDNEEVEFKKNFIGAFAGKSELEPIRESLEIGLDFIKENKETLVYKTTEEIRGKFLEDVSFEGSKLVDVMSEFKEKILSGSIKQSNPNYLAFPDAGNSVAGLCAEILIAFTNQNLIATTKSAPTATFAEIEVIRWLRKLVGFSDADNFPTSALDVGGGMVSGGTMANTVALLVARNHAFPMSRTKGMNSEGIRPILIVAGPTINHYSHIASFWWLGMGEENVVYVNTLADYRFDCDDLEKKLKEYNNHKTSKVVAVICLAGDSRTTTIENFEKVVTITKSHNVWLHVDACHGGVLIFSKKFTDKLKGLSDVDSISMDPHKGLCITYPSSVVLFKDVNEFRSLAKSTDITIQKGSYDLGQVTPFIGSKSFDSLKLWFLIKNLGLSGIDKLVEYRFNLAKKWSEAIDNSTLFESLNDVDLNSVVFSVSAKKVLLFFPEISLMDEGVIDTINKSIHDQVYKEGFICIHNFDIIDTNRKSLLDDKKRGVLGVTFGNPNTSDSDFPEYIYYLEKIARSCIENIKKHDNYYSVSREKRKSSF